MLFEIYESSRLVSSYRILSGHAPQLTSLFVTIDLTDECVEFICAFSNLQTLRICTEDPIHEPFRLIEGLTCRQTLRELIIFARRTISTSHMESADAYSSITPTIFPFLSRFELRIANVTNLLPWLRSSGCPRLSAIAVGLMEHTTHTFDGPESWEDLFTLLANSHGLTSVKINAFQPCSPVWRSLNLSPEVLKPIQSLSLIELYLKAPEFLHFNHNHLLESVEKWPLLQTLRISTCERPTLTMDSLELIARSLPHLRILDLPITGRAIKHIPPLNHRLEILALAGDRLAEPHSASCALMIIRLFPTLTQTSIKAWNQGDEHENTSWHGVASCLEFHRLNKADETAYSTITTN